MQTEEAMIESPCVKICELNGADICVGCGRSRAEIGGWSAMSNEQKKRVVAAARERLKALEPKPRGAGRK